MFLCLIVHLGHWNVLEISVWIEMEIWRQLFEIFIFHNSEINKWIQSDNVLQSDNTLTATEQNY